MSSSLGAPPSRLPAENVVVEWAVLAQVSSPVACYSTLTLQGSRSFEAEEGGGFGNSGQYLGSCDFLVIPPLFMEDGAVSDAAGKNPPVRT